MITKAGHSPMKHWPNLAKKISRHSIFLEDLAVDYAVVKPPASLKGAHVKLVAATRAWSRGYVRLSDHLRSAQQWDTKTWRRATAPILHGNALFADWRFAVKVSAKRWELRLPWLWSH